MEGDPARPTVGDVVPSPREDGEELGAAAEDDDDPDDEADDDDDDDEATSSASARSLSRNGRPNAVKASLSSLSGTSPRSTSGRNTATACATALLRGDTVVAIRCPRGTVFQGLLRVF